MKKQLRTLTKLLAAVIACCLSVAVHAQTTVRGTVTDADGMPLVGATVIVITGTQSGGGTTTDANGKFAIAAAPGQRLSVSYIGYKETSVEVTTKTDYDIRLESDNAQIDEVIVVGYGTQKKVNVTGSVATIDSKAFDKRPIVSTSAALQGHGSRASPSPRSRAHRAMTAARSASAASTPSAAARPRRWCSSTASKAVWTASIPT